MTTTHSEEAEPHGKCCHFFILYAYVFLFICEYVAVCPIPFGTMKQEPDLLFLLDRLTKP